MKKLYFLLSLVPGPPPQPPPVEDDSSNSTTAIVTWLPPSTPNGVMITGYNLSFAALQYRTDLLGTGRRKRAVAGNLTECLRFLGVAGGFEREIPLPGDVTSLTLTRLCKLVYTMYISAAKRDESLRRFMCRSMNDSYRCISIVYALRTILLLCVRFIQCHTLSTSSWSEQAQRLDSESSHLHRHSLRTMIVSASRNAMIVHEQTQLCMSVWCFEVAIARIHASVVAYNYKQPVMLFEVQ